MSCRICQSAEVSCTVIAREMMFGFRDPFSYFECAGCGCVQIQEIPADPSKYYPRNYYSFQGNGAMERWLKKRWAACSYHGSDPIGSLIVTAFGKNAAVESVRRTGVKFDADILDVGCGDGDFLLQLHSLGFSSLTGVDPFLADDIVYKNGVRVLKKKLGEMTGQFDLITLHHSLEHMEDPAEILRQAGKILRTGGQVVVRVPVAGAAWKRFRANWVQLDPPRHIFLPTVKSMEILAARAGLRLGQVVFDSTEFQFWASEQYQRDIPLRDPRSQLSLLKRLLAFGKMRRQRQLANEWNARGEGDAACFHFHKAG
ncbi:MAG TPA: class I SAM-dependent methyltransferase [Candidatus Dormibacteraeota bacterium]|jgi:SAM-dependent methyltransferase|nr:class I SAM-dependent methyltransferase [Candidatus Dormibacteraeota bacterium]